MLNEIRYYKMKYLLLLLSLSYFGCTSRSAGKYVFFLHNRYAQLSQLAQPHPEYGFVEYNEIVASFRNQGFTVISELRPKDTDGIVYAKKVVGQVDSLVTIGVNPSDITLVGTSMGGYIAKYVSSTLKNKNLNYVLIGCCQDEDIIDDPDVELCGNILSIYEQSDSLGRSCLKTKEYSKAPIPHYYEIELKTGLRHGFLYKAMGEWIDPASKWAMGRYDLFESTK